MGVWSDDAILVDLETARVSVHGPIEFVREIDWPRVEAVALLLARALGPVDALKVAVWREYRGWRRRLMAAEGRPDRGEFNCQSGPPELGSHPESLVPR